MLDSNQGINNPKMLLIDVSPSSPFITLSTLTCRHDSWADCDDDSLADVASLAAQRLLEVASEAVAQASYEEEEDEEEDEIKKGRTGRNGRKKMKMRKHSGSCVSFAMCRAMVALAADTGGSVAELRFSDGLHNTSRLIMLHATPCHLLFPHCTFFL